MELDQHRVELRVGETLWVGHCRVTVVDIEGDEVVFRIDDSAVSEPREVPPRPR